MDKKLDVYAWSMTMYETVCRMRPWDDCDAAQKVQNLVISGERPEIPLAVQEKITNNFGLGMLLEFIRDAWAQDGFQRPSMEIIFKALVKISESM